MDMATGFLVPLVMAGGIDDPGAARALATATLMSYGLDTEADLMKIMQIVGFGLGAMDNLRLSAGDATSLSMKQRLRGCANGLNRSAQQNNQALEKDRHARGGRMFGDSDPMTMPEQAGTAAWPQPDVVDQPAMEAEYQAAIDAARQQIAAARAGIAQPENASAARSQTAATCPASSIQPQPPATETVAAEAIAAKAAEPRPAAATTAGNRMDIQPAASANTQAASEVQRRLMWASAMTDVAAELQADLAGQTPAERADNQSWIASLTGAAGSLAAQPPSAGTAYKAGLLSSTTLGRST